MTTRLAGWSLVLLLGCGAAPAETAYTRAVSAAGAATARGRHAEAGERYLNAARTAESARDRDEMTYRAASAFERAGADDRATALHATLAKGRGERAARASFDQARLVGRRDAARGDALLLAAIRRFPDSGLAPNAVRTHLSRREEAEGPDGALRAVEPLLAELGSTELGETLRYERARCLERAERHELAKNAYLETAARHPYPTGALWDDALAGAARAEEKLGRPREAIRILERLLAEREPSSIVGSYERSRYAPARFRIAEIRRDVLGEPAAARREFRRVHDDFPTSLLRDDALYQEALVARAMADAEGVCAAMELLARTLPDSRFAGCAPKLCPRIQPTPGARCASPTGDHAAPQSTSSFSFSSSSSSSPSSSSSSSSP